MPKRDGGASRIANHREVSGWALCLGTDDFGPQLHGLLRCRVHVDCETRRKLLTIGYLLRFAPALGADTKETHGAGEPRQVAARFLGAALTPCGTGTQVRMSWSEWLAKEHDLAIPAGGSLRLATFEHSGRSDSLRWACIETPPDVADRPVRGPARYRWRRLGTRRGRFKDDSRGRSRTSQGELARPRGPTS